MEKCFCISQHLARVESLNGKEARKSVEKLNKKIKGKHLCCHKCGCALFPWERDQTLCIMCQL